jgi:hypothetical protein
VFALLLWSAPAAAQAPLQKIEAADHQAVAATITYEIRTSDFTVTRWTAFLPEPPELPSQAKVKVAADPPGRLVSEKSPLARKVRMIDLPVAKPVPGAKLKLKLDVKATLRTRKLVPLAAGEKPSAVPALTPAEKKFYLAPSSQIDFDRADFGEWLDAKKLRREKAEPPLAYAARVLEVIRADYAYTFDPKQDKRAAAVCGAKATDCGGMSYVFAGAMRAADVPTRILVGRLAKPRMPDRSPMNLDHDQPHVRAEIHVAGLGWVPVDVAYANGDKGKPVAEFLGHDPGDLLVLHVDLDLKLPYPDRERTAVTLQVAPSYWTMGRGTFDGSYGPSGWALTVTPLGGK